MDLAQVAYEWSMQWWDAAEHMVWNPSGFDRNLGARRVHLVPNTAWLAYAHFDAANWSEGVAAVRALLALQYDEPGTVLHGTYRRFLEQPAPPTNPVMWEHYDPNWRQFVGTTLAVLLEDFGTRFEPELASEIEHSIELACAGEADGRIPVSYSNPALMRAWLDAWYGRRVGDARLIVRGLDFARAIVAQFDAHSAFDEFNSPTYYGIDLYALRLWRTFPPAEFFADHGARLETALWRSAGAFYNAQLTNFCGPFTRSYNPDATQSVVLLSLWIWALLGREFAPLPVLTPDVDHGHDLMAGPLFARLAAVPEEYDLVDFRRFTETRTITQQLAHRRTVTAWIAPDLMIGAESSAHDWNGWEQFIPATAHWASGTLWLIDAHVVDARASEATLTIRTNGNPRFRLRTPAVPRVTRNRVTVADIDLTFTGGVAIGRVDDDLYELSVRAPNGVTEVALSRER